MANKIQCETHGECEEAFVCSHLVGDASGFGFNRDEPSEEHPFPDAWCDDCELIRAAHHGWNEEAAQLAHILFQCSGCYERSRIRNTHPTVTLDDLAELRWKCGSCEEWHTGPCLDFTYDSPAYWQEEHKAASNADSLAFSSIDSHPSNSSHSHPRTFLNEDYCAIDDEDFFVRGNIHLPIIGSAETFRWGVWGSLSRENFEKLLSLAEDPQRVELPAMFSWLSNQIKEYPDTLNLKMYAQVQEPGWRPFFELERTDHPLSIEYHNGITPERVKEIMMNRLPGNE